MKILYFNIDKGSSHLEDWTSSHELLLKSLVSQKEFVNLKPKMKALYNENKRHAKNY